MWYGLIIVLDVLKMLHTDENVYLCSCQVPYRAEEITIPADVTPERVPTHIVDYSGTLLPCLLDI